jgi:CDP-glucose 4,6-dehydratase
MAIAHLGRIGEAILSHVFDDFYRGKRVLITGHTGFKGAWLALWLKSLGAEVMGYALEPSTQPNLFEVAELSDAVHSVIGDIRDTVKLCVAFDEHQPELVFHLAAQALVGSSYQDPLETFSVNVVGTASVLDACRATSSVKSILVVTSDKCYENQGWERGYIESDPMGGFDPYSASKGCAELVAASYRRSFFEKAGVGLASARAGNVIGGGDFTVGRLVPDCLKALIEGRSIRLRYPRSIRPWQHVLEPLSGYLNLMMRLNQDPATFAEGWNFGPELMDARPVQDLVELAYQAWGQASAWVQEPGDHPHEAAVLRLDSTQAQERLGWNPAWHLSDAVAHTVAWQKAFAQGQDVLALMRAQIHEHGAQNA